MVLGNTSKYVEGFESFTADDQLMVSNLKQAVNYTKENMAIGDVTSKLSNTSSKKNSTNISGIPTTTFPNSMKMPNDMPNKMMPKTNNKKNNKTKTNIPGTDNQSEDFKDINNIKNTQNKVYLYNKKN